MTPDAKPACPPAETLAAPLTLPCGQTLPNRIAKAAMSEALGDASGKPTRRLIRLYERWAAGGAGLLITGNVMVDPNALGEPRNVVVEDARDLALLKAWAEASRRHGARVWMQLNHPGRQGPRALSKEVVAPSAVPIALTPGVFATPRALTEPEIENLIKRFARSAEVARMAGFDGIQLHGAHGYLISQFLSPSANRREDDWGGTPEKRRRFLIEILRACRRAVGEDFAIGIKLNSADFQRGGFSEEESIELVTALNSESVDLIEISGGTYEQAAMMGEATRESTRQREAYFLAYAQKVRALSTRPLMLTGGFRTAAGMAEAITSGAIDVVGLARPLALYPDLPNRLLSGEDVRVSLAPRQVGIKLLDSGLEIFWYEQQLHRMADGCEPDPDRSPLLAALTGMIGMGFGMATQRRGY